MIQIKIRTWLPQNNTAFDNKLFLFYFRSLMTLAFFSLRDGRSIFLVYVNGFLTKKILSLHYMTRKVCCRNRPDVPGFSRLDISYKYWALWISPVAWRPSSDQQVGVLCSYDDLRKIHFKQCRTCWKNTSRFIMWNFDFGMLFASRPW